MLAIIIAFGLTVLVTTRYAVSTAVDQQLHRQLEVGSRVWNQSHDAQLAQLTERLLLTAEDFGFRQAVATADPPTLESVLGNQVERLGVQYAILLDVDGQTTSRYLPDSVKLPDVDFGTILRAARRDGFAAGVVSLSGQPLRFALVPVFAPQLVAWVAVGERIERDTLERFELISGLDAGLLVGFDCQLAAASGPLSSLQQAPGFCAQVDAGLVAQEWNEVEALGGRPLLAIRLSAETATPVWLLMSSSRELAMRPFEGLQSRALWLGIGAALLTLVLASWIGARVSRPVARLAEVAARIREGEYDSDLAVSGNDELGQLADAFSSMQRAIAEREQRILHQAGHDRLTGLPNREQALGRLSGMVGAAGQDSAPGAVVRIDIRRFREVNDLLGHQFGDEVLVHCAERLRGVVRGDDLVARVGGNEFLVLMQGISPADALDRVGRLTAAMQAPLLLSRTELKLDVSVGIALFPDDVVDAAQLLRRSDIALASAKRGGVPLAVYESGKEEAHLRRLRLIGDLRHAEERGELHLAFQPQVALDGDVKSHAEALLRWRHPELGNVPPDEFIALAEYAGLIPSITRFVIDRALQHLSAWRSSGMDCGVAVNLSALDLLRPELPEVVLELLGRYGVPPGALVVEVTESAVMQDLATSIAALQRLRQAGVLVAVDDFGTGQSSLAQLKRLPVDQLKIDKSFVMALRAGTDDEQIVGSILQLAHGLSLVVVAEGVETEDGLAVLRARGCELAQGYLLSRPLSAEDFQQWLQRSQGGGALAAGP